MSFLDLADNDVGDVGEYDSFCGLIGGERPSTYSVSPKMWNAVFDRFGISAVYVPLDVREQNLAPMMSELRKDGKFRGANVTVPYKKAVVGLLDAVDPQAAEYSAVNTVRMSGGAMTGYNTDGVGQVRNLEGEIGSLRGKRVLQIGAGGAGNAVSYALVAEGAELIISNRTVEKARELSERIQRFFGLGSAPAFGDESSVKKYASKVDVILNVSLKGQHGSPFEKDSALAPTGEGNAAASMEIAESVPEGTLFADIVYNPRETVFLRHGRETGHRTLNGSGMLLHQAVRACQILYGRELEGAGTDEIADVMRRRL